MVAARRLGALAALLTFALAVPVPADASRGFFGVVPQAPLSRADLDRMRGTVGAVRMPVYWSAVEPRPDEWDFAAFDEQVEMAARRGVAVLPFLYGSPAWVAADPAIPPLGGGARREWLEFVRRLVGRYGPGGSLWAGRGWALPIRRWQVWNEPNFPVFWRPGPEPRRYAALLGATARAIRRADRGAVVVAAGVAPVERGMQPAAFMRRLYAARGAKRGFDVAALHPYSSSPAGVASQVRQLRGVMAGAGDAGTPLQVSEIGVASGAAVPTSFALGPRGQARFLRRALGLLVAQRRRWRIAGVNWFSWRDSSASDRSCAFCARSGLLRRDGSPKPAWRAFRRLARTATRHDRGGLSRR